MKKIIISAFAIFAVTAAVAQNSDATLNSVTETYTLNSDGSIDYDYFKSLTYNTQFAFNSLFGETFIVYKSGISDVEDQRVLYDSKRWNSY